MSLGITLNYLELMTWEVDGHSDPWWLCRAHQLPKTATTLNLSFETNGSCTFGKFKNLAASHTLKIFGTSF